MHIWFKTVDQPEPFRGESPMPPENLYAAWQEWRVGNITSFRVNVKIGRYVFSFRIEDVLADRTFQEAIEENFHPVGEMATWPPSAA